MGILGFGGFEFHGRETASLVAAIAEGLAIAAAAGAPVVALAGFDFDGIRGFFGQSLVLAWGILLETLLEILSPIAEDLRVGWLAGLRDSGGLRTPARGFCPHEATRAAGWG
jgi:hypothetical protein